MQKISSFILIIYCGILILSMTLSCNSPQGETYTFDARNQITNPKTYIIPKTKETITIDGVNKEEAWQNAPFTSAFIDIEGVLKPKFETKAKMLWDEKYLYVYTKMEEPHIWGNLRQRDTIIYYNNDFEVFIDPSSNTQYYAELEINALGTEWDLLLTKPYRNGGLTNFNWNMDSLKSAVFYEGTVNNSSDIDSFWSLEIAIPLAAIVELKNKPRRIPIEGEQWRLNFSRVEWDHDINAGKYSRKMVDGKYLPEYNWVWSNQKVINMHEPEKWGIVQFTELNHIDNTDFIEDPDHSLKQSMYAIMRNILKGELKTLRQAELYSHANIELTIAEDEKINTTFFKTKMGFEISAESAKTQNQITINQDGNIQIRMPKTDNN